MTTDTRKRIFIGAITGIASAVFVFTLVHALVYAPESDIGVPDTHANVSVPPAEEPDRLQIPSLSVDAKVQFTTVNSKGNMGVPTNYTDVAWYRWGTVPGQTGSAVIDGHVDNGLGLDGVFKHLGNIKIGDEVAITTHAGRTLTFAVIDVQSYYYKEVPLDTVFNKKDGQYLNLITCEGNWVKGEKTYDQRLIVYTRLISST